MVFFIILVAFITFVVYMIYKIKRDNRRHEEEMKNRRNRRWSDIEELYGKSDNILDYPYFHLGVFNETRNVVIFEKDKDKKIVFPFDSIVSCTVSLGHKIVGERIIPATSKTTYTSKIKGKSVVGRALIGGAVAGPIGAVIGGVTASKNVVGETTYIPEERHKVSVTSVNLLVEYLNGEETDFAIFNPPFEVYANDAKAIIDEIIDNCKGRKMQKMS